MKPEIKDAQTQWNRLLVLKENGATQEEVGLRGVRTVAAVAAPELAIVLEGAPADDVAVAKGALAAAERHDSGGGGAYVYRVQGGGKSFTGTIVVAR